MLQYLRCFTYNISSCFIVQMYAGISPEILQFLKTLKYITELYQFDKLYQNYDHQVKHLYHLTM